MSQHLSLIVTGSMLGKIVIWDLELLRCEGVMIGGKSAIVGLQFVDKFPLLVSVGSCGTISVFAVRGCPGRLRQYCLGRFLNVSPDNDQKMVNTAITAMTCEVIPNPRFDSHRHQPVNELTAVMDYYAEQKKSYRSDDEERDANWFTKSVFLARLDSSFTEYTTVFNEESFQEKQQRQSKQKKGAAANSTKVKSRAQDPEEGDLTVEAQEEYCTKFYPPFGEHENPEHFNLIISDESGSVKWLDLTTFIRKPLEQLEDARLSEMQADPMASRPPYIERCKPYAKSKIGFMPSRRMEAEAGSLALAFLEMCKNRPSPKLVLACRSV